MSDMAVILIIVRICSLILIGSGVGGYYYLENQKSTTETAPSETLPEVIEEQEEEEPGVYQELTAKKLVVDDTVNSNNLMVKNIHAKGDVLVTGHLFVDGHIYMKDRKICDIGGIGFSGDGAHLRTFNPEIDNVFMLPRHDGVLYRKLAPGTTWTSTTSSFVTLPTDWKKAQLTRTVRSKPQF